MKPSTCLALLPILSPLASGQVLHEFFGPAFGELGASVDGGQDVDSDGVPDLLMTIPGDETVGFGDGSIQVRSGADGSLLHYIGTNSLNGFGSDGALISDINGDNHADFIVGAWLDDQAGNDAGRAWVYSGSDGALLFELAGPMTDGAFGYRVCGIGDANADGTPDFAIGAHGTFGAAGHGAGRVYVYSGVDASLLYFVEGEASGYLVGISFAAAGDVNADGHADLIIGVERDGTVATDAGSARVHSGVDGSLIYLFPGEFASDYCGRVVAGAGDVNADGYDDLLVPSSGNDENGDLAGKVRVFSGFDGSLLMSFWGYSNLDAIGSDVVGVGDMDGDGFDDIAISSDRSAMHIMLGGHVRVHSGADGSLLHIWHGTETQARFGRLAATGDVNLDGYPDLMVGTPFSDLGSFEAGQVQVFSGAPLEPAGFCFGDNNGASCPCGNPDSSAGCANSTGKGATLIASGSFSLSQNDLWFSLVDLPHWAVGLVITSDTAVAIPFMDGKRCVGGSIQRVQAQSAGSGTTLTFGPGLPSHINLAAGMTSYFQAWYRDPNGPCGSHANLSNGLQLTWTP